MCPIYWVSDPPSSFSESDASHTFSPGAYGTFWPPRTFLLLVLNLES
ncbi:hypothetical protein RchiOBHm_Chr7g0225091 [Rosa chinensis]|uniref:Uncharacterized protein n=1 Tax=Rosa chinensis TaxID=74649 RepID=A0A2P6PE08_ROSCH|nr:hypothetical protein RchiOBHm_Chr7g0225091 [Rosa chinensis]